MKPAALLLIGLVAASNIGLHVLLLRAASGARTYQDALFSRRFAVAFLVGTVTALLMLGVYVSRVELARAIVLMGALSILGGAAVGLLFFRDRLDPVEWALLTLMALLYVYRGWQVFAATGS